MMTSLPKLKLEDTSKVITVKQQQATKLEGGFSILDFETAGASRPLKRFFPASLQKGRAVETETSPFMSGIPTYSTSLRLKGTNESSDFVIRQSGDIGQEILNADGDVVAWTVDAELAQRICKLLNQ